MTKIIINGLETDQCANMRKGLSTIASRQSGSFVYKADNSSTIAENVSAPKEITKLKCHAPSILAL